MNVPAEARLYSALEAIALDVDEVLTKRAAIDKIAGHTRVGVQTAREYVRTLAARGWVKVSMVEMVEYVKITRNGLAQLVPDQVAKEALGGEE